MFSDRERIHDVNSPKKTYRQSRGTWKDVQHHSLLEKYKSKVQWSITSHQLEWPSSKNLQTVNAGESVEKREPSYTVGGDVTGIATMEDSKNVF